MAKKGPVEKIIAGNVILFRWVCPRCKAKMLVGNSRGAKFECDVCGYKTDFLNGSTRTLVSKPYKRRRFEKGFTQKIVDQQEGKCFWCGREFGEWIRYGNKFKDIRPCIDHVTPFAYCLSDANKNLVAACSICNMMKNSKIFAQEEACRDYLLKKWEERLLSGKISE